MDNIFSTYSSSASDTLLSSLGFAYLLLIIIAPVILGYFFLEAFLIWRKNKFIFEQETTLLQIKLPKEVLKSPLAMELFLTSLYQTKGEGTFIKRWFKGQVRPWFSLELVSINGEIRFYIWTWKFWQHLIESQMYAQYPDIEIKEAEDYTQKIDHDLQKIDLWGCNFVLTKPSHYPIRTYEDYNLDKDPKEEMKIDPMTAVLEYLGGLKEGEQAWIQIIVRAHKNEATKPGTWFEKVDWTHAAKEEIKHLKEKDKQVAGEIKLTGASLSKGERDVIDAIERNVAKVPFDCGIRAIYLAKKEKWNDINVAGMNGAFRQYNSYNLNGFKTDHVTEFNYPWQDFADYRLKHKKEHMLHEYQLRAFFHRPHRAHWFVLNTEALATLFHFPGEVAKTPSIERVEAKRAEPPANLPI